MFIFNTLRRIEYSRKNPHEYHSQLFANLHEAPDRLQRCKVIGELLHGYYHPSLEFSFPEDDEVVALCNLVRELVF